MRFFKPKETIIEKIVYSTDPIEIVKRITDDEFKWYDYTQLPENERLKYYNAAQEVLKNPAIMNEIARLNAEWALWAAQQAKNFGGVLAMRHQMSGIKLLMERLADITNPTQKENPAKEPYSGI